MNCRSLSARWFSFVYFRAYGRENYLPCVGATSISGVAPCECARAFTKATTVHQRHGTACEIFLLRTSSRRLYSNIENETLWSMAISLYSLRERERLGRETTC